MTKKLTLKEALKKGKLKQFIKEHEGQEYDPAKFDATLKKLLGTSTEAQGASAPDSSGSYSGTRTPRRKKKGA